MSYYKNYSNMIPLNNSNIKRTNTSKGKSVNFIKDINNDINNRKANDELKNIFNSIISESSKSSELKYNSKDLLSIYVRRNRNKMNDILIEISKIFNNIKINSELLIQCMDGIFNSLIDNNQIINFLNLFVPILIKYLYHNKNQNLSSINKLVLFIGKLIKQGGIYIRELIEYNIDILLDQFNEENKENEDNRKAINIKLFCQIFKNSSLLAFNKIVGKDGFDRFLKIIDCFKDCKKEIRIMTGELIMYFIKMFSGRDKETKISYLKLTYEYVLHEYNDNLENTNNAPNDYNIVSGYITIVERIHLSEPSFFRDSSVYLELINNLFKCIDSTNISIKKEFIKFIPQLYHINKNEFISKYKNQFLEYFSTLLNAKTNSEIRNQLLLTVGKLSYILKDDGYKNFINQFFSSIISLISDKTVLDDDFLKCLSDLLNNKINIYVNKNKFIDVLIILPRIFKTFLSISKIDYLVSVMKFYNNDSIENIITAITSLNAISYILFEDFFPLEHFKKAAGNKKKYLNQKLHNILINMRADISTYISEQNNSDILNVKNILIENLKLNNNNIQLISNSLLLFSLIPNNLFYKDMFIFLYEKLLPLLTFVPNKIYKKIFALFSCDFVRIYQDDINLSEYIFFNIGESIISTSLEERNIKTQLYCYKIINKKEEFTEIFTKHKNNSFIKVLGELSSIKDYALKEKYIKEISKLALKDTDKNYYYVYIKKNIISLVFKLYHLEDIIEKDNLSYDLYYFTTNLINFFYPTLVVVIMEIANYLILTDDLKSIMIINIFKSVIEILKSNLIKQIKDDIIFKENCDLMFILCFDIIRMESIDESKYDLITEIIYLIIKQENIDLFNIEEVINRIKKTSIFSPNQNDQYNDRIIINLLLPNKVISEKLKIILEKQINKNVIEFLYRNILNVDNENCVLNTLKIFGLCGAIDPNKINNFFNEKNNIKYLLEFDNNYKSIEERGIQIITFNHKLKQYEEMDTSFTDSFNIKAVLYCMELLKMNKQQELSLKIISSLNSLIKSIKQKESNLIDIILPTLIQIIPKFQIEQQKSLFECIGIILNNFEEKSKKYLDDVIPLVINYLEKNYLDIISKLISLFFEKYRNEFENYYSIIIPKYIRIIKMADSEYFNYDKIFILFVKNNEISSYLKILSEELKTQFFEETKPKYVYGLLCLIEQICINKNAKSFYFFIISIILSKIQFMISECITEQPELRNDSKKIVEYFLKTSDNSENNLSIIYKALDIFSNIKDNSYQEFTTYLPLIYNTFNFIGLMNYPTIKQKLKTLVSRDIDYTFITCEQYLKKMSSETCKINCIYGFNSFKKHKRMKREKAKTFIDIDNTEKYKIINNELVMSVFDNNHCTLEEDWDEWNKSIIKLLLEQSPSYYIDNCRVITDYYVSIASELSSYGFYTLYMNSNDKIKTKLTKCLTAALKSPKANDNLILSILDLLESMERRNTNMFLEDYHLYGNIAYNLKAYAKSLFYLERDFSMSNDAQVFEKLIKLYYQLGVPECAFGLIKLAEEHQYEDVDNYENKFIWYINLKDYRKSLGMIEEKLETEFDINRIAFLKKYKHICLSGLMNWEEILSEEEYNYNINIDEDNNIINDKYNEIKNVLERGIFLSKVCLSLDKWDDSKTHILKINKILKEKFDLELPALEIKDELNNSDIFFIKNNENKNFSYIQSDEKTVSDDYISYNDLILKNIYLFNKIDETKIFDLNVMTSFIYIMEGKYEIATKYKNDAKEIILNKIKSLLKESHTRGYSFLINNQELSYLEDIIEYKKNHDGDVNYLKEIKKQWDKSFSKISLEPQFYRRLLLFYRFLFPNKALFENIIKLSNIYRKFGFYEQSQNIFQKLRNNLKSTFKNETDTLFLNEQKIKIELGYNKCLFEKGELEESIKNSKILVDLLEEEGKNNIYSKISNKLKGKIYGDYALYQKKKFSITILYSLKNLSYLKPKAEFYITKTNENHSPKLVHKKYLSLNNNKFTQLKSKVIAHKNKNHNLLLSYSKNDSHDSTFNEFLKTKRFNEILKETKSINKYLKLATKYNKSNYKFWYNFSSFNYGCYKSLHYIRIKVNEGMININENEEYSLDYEISFAKNAINGIKKCLSLSGNNSDQNYLNCIRLYDMFFNIADKNDELLSLITSAFFENNSKIFVQTLPLLVSRMGNKNMKILEVLVRILVEICRYFPYESLIPLIINKYSSSIKRKSIANQILCLVEKKNPELKNVIEDYKMFIKQLNKCSLLLHEKWKEAIEEASKMLVNKNYNGLINQLNKVHNQMNENPDNLYEIHFNQCFHIELKEAENYLKKYIKTQNERYIKEAWEIYQTIYNKIQIKYKNMINISLEYISPLLSSIKENKIGLPGYYFLDKLNRERKQLIIGKIKDINILENGNLPVFLKKMDKFLYVLNTKQKPRKISFIGTDNKEYKYLLKSHEDLRQDERIIQVFNFVNSMLSLNKETSNKNLLITIYPVIPLSHITGLIGFLPNCDTISHLITEERKTNNLIANIELNSLFQLYPKYDSGTLLSKVEAFKEVNRNTPGLELNNIIWTKSVNCESWLVRRTNYSRSLSVMSVVGYILGLGDRHPNNLMMDRQNGKIIHIDYGDCFEIAMKRNKFPEKVPFRLTRMLVKALGITKVEGTFRIISEKVMQLLRDNRDSLLAILNTLVYDPLVSFRLMVPYLMKMKEKEKEKNKAMSFNSPINEYNNNVNISSSVMNTNTFEKFAKVKTFSIRNTRRNNSSKMTFFKEEEKNEKIEEDNVDKEKEEKKRIENEERELLNYYEEKDEIEFDELNKIAQIVINRINEKLWGMDFNNEKSLDVKEQVDRLINQATSNENLAQSYLGWCPFW